MGLTVSRWQTPSLPGAARAEVLPASVRAGIVPESMICSLSLLKIMQIRRFPFTWVLWVALLTFDACAPRTSLPEPMQERAAPTWIRSKPDDSSLLQGVGFAPDTGYPDQDLAQAVTRAREDLLLELQANIRRRAAGGESGAGVFERTSWTEFGTSLNEVVPKETYYEAHRKRHWAYVTMPLSELDRLLSRRLGVLEPKARKLLKSSLSLESSGRIVEALRDISAALQSLVGPEGLYVKGSGSALLREEVEGQLSRLADQIEFRRISSPERTRTAGDRETPFTVMAVRKADGVALAGVPVAFRFTQGGGLLSTPSPTNSDGHAFVYLRAADPRLSPLKVEAGLDVRALLNTERKSPLPEAALTVLRLPQTQFQVIVDPPRLLLTQIERGGSSGDRAANAAAAMGEVFRKQGVEVADASVKLLVKNEVFSRVEQGRDPGDVPDTDLVGVVVISLLNIRKERGRLQDIMYGEGEVLFRLFDLEKDKLVIDIRVQQQVSGFSQGDIERNFFLQSTDEMRNRLIELLANQPYFGVEGTP